ncbi:S-methyl-5'-thioadenosine phosphorylase [Candidatus Brocadiaceae bacterium B188]|nr:S-methyl-5'-thioadenosine phosphorylase [Candidatus Brocadia sapporoensis]MEB2308251.1 S-methyl-5'-thioadenosine phosphorylase [Candidatus Brocadiaceae bacterium]QQR66803.1 MAG: S-methyl-5'-thioadenosine phosphorylase [Candidatus Brocadia sp.]RZV59232.1 MAG: S-methyl-5'-thioadenosine phosphorylase [Candidatus Brocadia sp. BROELEC01]TWU53775.1 S-methyl-5'-thioadenosine phosphorylase [Candidatus Brocadiaceae bacterium B188]
MKEQTIGIIGGSGLYNIEGIKEVKSISVDTPFGKPSDNFTIGILEGRKVAFLPRHGKGHTILPSELNFRANIYGMKKLGVEHIIAVSAVGSMKEEIKPLDMVIPDQFFDRTRGRISTFFGEGIVGHVSFADPVCSTLANSLWNAAKSIGVHVHKGGTYLCMEGPLFSTRAESQVYRQWGVSVIGMTNLQEAKLAREAEICYSTLAMATDYDCWHVSEEAVTLEMIIGNLNKNTETAKRILKAVIPKIEQKRTCACTTAVQDAIVTHKDLIPESTKKKLDIIFGKYLR